MGDKLKQYNGHIIKIVDYNIVTFKNGIHIYFSCQK